MPTIAIIKDGAVSNIISAGDDWQDLFPNAVLAETANMRDIYTGGVFTRPTVQVPIDLPAYAAQKRYAAETGGIKWLGVPIKTGREDRALIYEAEISAKDSAAFTTTWIAADGSSHDLTADMVSDLASSVRAHVAACFAAYSGVMSGIAAGTIATAAQIDAAEWPPNT